jgi:hypothetical protein
MASADNGATERAGWSPFTFACPSGTRACGGRSAEAAEERVATIERRMWQQKDRE